MMDIKSQIGYENRQNELIQKQNDLALVRGAILKEANDMYEYKEKFLKFNVQMNDRHDNH